MLKNPARPGELLWEAVIEDRHLTIESAAVVLGVDEAELRACCEGQAPVTAALAEAIAAGFGGGADLWLRLQQSYDRAQARLATQEEAGARLAAS